MRPSDHHRQHQVNPGSAMLRRTQRRAATDACDFLRLLLPSAREGLGGLPRRGRRRHAGCPPLFARRAPLPCSTPDPTPPSSTSASFPRNPRERRRELALLVVVLVDDGPRVRERILGFLDTDLVEVVMKRVTQRGDPLRQKRDVTIDGLVRPEGDDVQQSGLLRIRQTDGPRRPDGRGTNRARRASTPGSAPDPAARNTTTKGSTRSRAVERSALRRSVAAPSPSPELPRSAPRASSPRMRTPHDVPGSGATSQ